MSAHTNPKTLIINLLKNNISVLDDSSGAIAGVVAGTWYSKRVIGDKGWMVTVGPTSLGRMVPNDIGANRWKVDNELVVNIWVPILENVDYSPERLRFSLKEEVKRLLFQELVDTTADIRFLHLHDWRDADEMENQMLRVELIVTVEWLE